MSVNTLTDTRYLPQLVGDTASIDLWYPRYNPIQFIQIGLMDMRAADDIRITYDFARDGWSIQQASRFEWDVDEPIDHDWQEVAFVEAWARAEREPFLR